MTRVTGACCRSLLLFMGWLLAMSCQEKSEPVAGSESHFLEQCMATCGSGFECLYGVCTQQCQADDACAPLFPTAECVAVSDRPAASACPNTSAPAFCDVRCAADGD